MYFGNNLAYSDGNNYVGTLLLSMRSICSILFWQPLLNISLAVITLFFFLYLLLLIFLFFIIYIFLLYIIIYYLR